MFQTPDWPSDQEEEDVKQSKKPRGSSSIPALVVTQPSDESTLPSSSSKKKKKKKRKKHDETSGSVDSVQKTDSSPTLKRKTSSVSEGGQPEDEEPTSKRKKLKKTMSDAVTTLSDAVTESASQVGGLLTRGIRFTSESEFIQFVSGKKKKKKKAKGKANSETSLEEGKERTENLGFESPSPEKKKKKKRKKSEERKIENSVEEKTDESEAFQAKKKKKKKADKDVANKTTEPEKEHRNIDESPSSKKKKKKKKKGTEDEKSDESLTRESKQKNGEFSDSVATSTKKTPNFDIAKLKAALEKEGGSTNGVSSSAKSFGTDVAKNRLKSSQFRFLNEKLYTQNGAQSLKMFKADKEAFRIYHEGYTEQVRKWPKDPLNIIISAIMKVSGNPVVADFGCGEARLARAVSSCCEKVYSFDLVSTNELVTACDMAHTPLENGSIDIAVFCLSLMGTNLRDYVKEANRVLKVGGILKIAEVESRFQDFPVDEFTKAVEKCGFKLKWKDLTHNYFYMMDFTKTEECKKKVPEFKLKACVYKKR